MLAAPRRAPRHAPSSLRLALCHLRHRAAATAAPQPPPRAPVVLITGASSGIGAALAARLSRDGARLVLAGRDAVSLNAVAARCGPEALPVVADVTDDAAVAALVDAALRRFGGIDAVVNNAGSAVSCRASALSTAGAAAELEANFLSAVRVTAAALPALRARGGGHVVCVGSLLALAPRRAAAQRAAYAASKAALHAWAHALHADVAQEGIAVTLLVPGPVATPFAARATAAAAAAAGEGGAAAGAPGASLPPLALPAQSAEDVAALIADALAQPPRARSARAAVFTGADVATAARAEHAAAYE
jgi:short-subunit dehydrogenase